MTTPADAPLAGRRVVTTRESPGRLDALLRGLGADVVHVPLIEVVDPPDRGAGLARALAEIDRFDWVVVTSRHGAERVGAAVPPSTRTAAVGTATADVLERLTGRRVDLVPEVQRAAAMVEAFAALRVGHDGEPWTALVAQADRAEPTLVDGLRDLGCAVEVCTAYSTRLRRPTADEVERVVDADVVAFASGSAAEAWARAIGVRTPPIVCAIGPTTARAARAHGLPVTAEASDHSIDGLARCVATALGAVL